jgi:drug/metabolite transporter (DMT)-like permease
VLTTGHHESEEVSAKADYQNTEDEADESIDYSLGIAS